MFKRQDVFDQLTAYRPYDLDRGTRQMQPEIPHEQSRCSLHCHTPLEIDNTSIVVVVRSFTAALKSRLKDNSINTSVSRTMFLKICFVS